MKGRSMRVVTVAVMIGFLGNLVGCGTLMYPERKGQSDGKLDLTVVGLDAIGLLFFLLPGIIAYAVDFNNGTIYLPGGSSAQLTDEELERIIAADGTVDQQGLSDLLREKSPEVQDIDLSRVQVKQVGSEAELSSLLAQRNINYASL